MYGVNQVRGNLFAKAADQQTYDQFKNNERGKTRADAKLRTKWPKNIAMLLRVFWIFILLPLFFDLQFPFNFQFNPIFLLVDRRHHSLNSQSCIVSIDAVPQKLPETCAEYEGLCNCKFAMGHKWMDSSTCIWQSCIVCLHRPPSTTAPLRLTTGGTNAVYLLRIHSQFSEIIRQMFDPKLLFLLLL